MSVLSLNLCQSIKACFSFSQRFIDYVNSKQRVVCDDLQPLETLALAEELTVMQ